MSNFVQILFIIALGMISILCILASFYFIVDVYYLIKEKITYYKEKKRPGVYDKFFLRQNPSWQISP